MSEQNKPTLKDKFKNFKGNRAAVVIVLLLIVAVTVIISVTVASNRAKKDKIESQDTGKTTETQQNEPSSTKKPAETQKPAQTPPADTSASLDVDDKMPSFILPVSGVLSKKHDSEIQVHSTTMNDLRVHLGIDIVTEAGAAVYSAADGTVSKIWEDMFMGNCIMIKHGGDSYTIYKNLSKTLPDGISEGTTVRSGQLIGSVGESAMIEIGEEPHLHFEMTVADLMVDPLQYFDDNALESLKIDASFE